KRLVEARPLPPPKTEMKRARGHRHRVRTAVGAMARSVSAAANPIRTARPSIYTKPVCGPGLRPKRSKTNDAGRSASASLPRESAVAAEAASKRQPRSPLEAAKNSVRSRALGENNSLVQCEIEYFEKFERHRAFRNATCARNFLTPRKQTAGNVGNPTHVPA